MILASTPTEDWFNQTTVHPLGLMLLVVLGAATFLVPRRYALVPMLILVCFVGPAQRIVVATLDFNFLRLMVLAGWARVLLRGEMWGWRWRPLDTVVLAWAICATLLATVLHTTMSAFIMRLGLLYDAHADELEKLGAHVVVPELVATGVKLAGSILDAMDEVIAEETL